MSGNILDDMMFLLFVMPITIPMFHAVIYSIGFNELYSVWNDLNFVPVTGKNPFPAHYVNCDAKNMAEVHKLSDFNKDDNSGGITLTEDDFGTGLDRTDG